MPVRATAQYPVNLVLEGRPVLLVGGGTVALRKAEGLAATGALVTVVAPAVDPGFDRLPGVTVHRRRYEAGEAGTGGYRLVLAATDDRSVNQAVHDDADAAGVWVNSADDPDRCTFTLPAVVRRGPLLLSVGTGGHSPAVASWVRQRLESEYGPEYEVLIRLMAEERAAVRSEGRSTEGLAWQSALESDMLSLIRGGRISEARERLKTCLSSS
ncbi:MAG TPA: bifunctional precorrin-2 dehydrogenase/sirohydrochlorin ferrochelatase [Acidimicrobiales bacterium]|nr:bifunctional precorrin-2 dehydrogenase/sirohydrochlorin ferrochelatase [Acidimicrobiales bacterium]